MGSDHGGNRWKDMVYLIPPGCLQMMQLEGMLLKLVWESEPGDPLETEIEWGGRGREL